MERKIVIVSALITIIVITAFGFANRSVVNNTNDSYLQVDSNKIELSYFGINGGLTVNNNNGSVSQFVWSPPDLFYIVQGNSPRNNSQQMYKWSITGEKLKNAKLLDDIIENYPSSWIKDYTSVVIAVNNGGEIVEEKSTNNVLTEAQLELFNSVDIASGIVIEVNYKKKNYNDNIESRQMNVSMLVVPEIEAEYEGGYEQMISYLKKNSLKEIAAKNFNHLPQPSISFVVNEEGIIENVKLIGTSRDENIDQLLIELVKKMPKWKPAQNEKGLNVKQEFMFNVGMDGC